MQTIVHENLTSPAGNERADAARHLGQLKCGDPMVIYALRDRAKQDDDDRVVYESTKALTQLGTMNSMD